VWVTEDGRIASRSKKKIVPMLIAAMQEVVEDLDNLILTVPELVDEINYHLPLHMRITANTWSSWQTEYRNANWEDLTTDEKNFLREIKRIMRSRKKLMWNRMRTAQSHWQKWAWLLERKYVDLRAVNTVQHQNPDGTGLFQNKTDEELEKLSNKYTKIIEITDKNDSD